MQKNCYTINEFCADSGISRSLFYKLAKQGMAPRLMKIGRRVCVSTEAYEDWRSQMEKQTDNLQGGVQ